ncbi:MAG: hypothetical protein AB2989_04610 [Candidatus Symbiodolus clandestinus]
MTKDETVVKERVNEIKRVLLEYIDVKSANVNADTDALETSFNKLICGDERGKVSINCLIDNSIQSRPGGKTKSDLKRLNCSEKDLFKFKVVRMFVDLIHDIKQYANRNGITINAGSFLEGGIKAMENSCSSYTEGMKKLHKIVAPANNIGQAVNAMPENNGVSAANGVPAVNPAPNEDCHCNLGDVCRHQVKFG